MNALRLAFPALVLLASVPPAFAAPGDLDATFNGTGTVTTVVPTGYSQGQGIARQADGKLLVAGSANVPVQGNPDNLDFLVVRYDTSGMLDPTFDGDGIVTTAIRDGEDDGVAVIQQTDGKIVVAGISYDAAFNDSTVTLVRYLDDGMLDSTFGGTGKVTTAIGTGTYDGALALVQQADGKLVVAGYTDTDIVVVRYDASGMPDTTFDTDGIVTTTVGASAIARAIVEQATDHKLVVAGGADGAIALVRYGTTGTPDATFNGTGVVTTSIGAGTAEARALVQQAADGRLVVACIAEDGVTERFVLVRYAANGMVDTAGFGTGGIATTTVGSGDSSALGLAEQADGKLVAAGVASNGTNRDFALVRYDTAGIPDATFGTGGIVTTPIGTGDDFATGILYQPDGFLAVAGIATNADRSVAAARYVGIEGIVTTTSTTAIASTTTTVIGTTSTTAIGSTTTTPGGTTTSTTLAGTLVPGGPAAKTDSDCYLELLVAGAQPSDVQGNKLVVCTDGGPCDAGPAGDDRCDVRLAGCTLQTDGAVPDCTPPAALASAKIRGKVAIDVSALLSAPQCSPFVNASVPAKRNKRGAYVAGKSKLVLKGLAKAPKGTAPRQDADKWTLQCMPAS
jgi:uncharacterized delta-60 repeat protein